MNSFCSQSGVHVTETHCVILADFHRHRQRPSQGLRAQEQHRHWQSALAAETKDLFEATVRVLGEAINGAEEWLQPICFAPPPLPDT